VEEVRDHIASSRGSRLALFGSDLRLGRFRPRRRSRRRPLAGEGAVEGFFHDLVIHPDNKYVINSPVPAISLICVRSFRFRFRARAGCCCFWNLTAATRRARSVGVLRSDGSRESPELLIDHDHKNPILFYIKISSSAYTMCRRIITNHKCPSGECESPEIYSFFFYLMKLLV